MRNIIVVIALCALALGCEPEEQTNGSAPAFPAERPNAETGRVVAVDWLGRGRIYAGRISGRQGELTGIVYADGDREWVEPSRIRPWPELVGQRVEVYTRGSAHAANVLEVRHGIYHVRFDDGGDTWASPDMLYALSAPVAAVPIEAPAAFPPRDPVPGAAPDVGDYVLAYWISGGVLQRTQPWFAQVLSATQNGVLHLRYSDQSEADVPSTAIVRIFERAPGPIAVGRRVWLADAIPVGTIIDMRAGLIKVRSGETERWIESESVIAGIPPIEATQLERGVRVTALWNGSSLYHATVVGVEGDQVMLAWHDGSTPSPVALSDVLEVW